MNPETHTNSTGRSLKLRQDHTTGTTSNSESLECFRPPSVWTIESPLDYQPSQYFGVARGVFPTEGFPKWILRSKLTLINDWPQRARRASYLVRDLAKSCSVTSRHLYRYFRAFGIRLKKSLFEFRMRDAEILLRCTRDAKLTSFLLAYSAESNFRRDFQCCFGITPNAFLEREPLSPPSNFVSVYEAQVKGRPQVRIKLRRSSESSAGRPLQKKSDPACVSVN